jgi:asparagine synthetase B (glutamine-hydrolysing)
MCGIVTQFSRNGHNVKEDSLWRATHDLHHRGPDGHRLWAAPHGRVGWATRVSIIDLATTRARGLADPLTWPFKWWSCRESKPTRKWR